MSGNNIEANGSTESIHSRISEIRQACQNNIEASLVDFDTQIGTPDSDYDEFAMSYLLSDLASEAADSGDNQLAKKCLDYVLRFTNSSVDALASIYLSNISAGNEEASILLHAALEEEKANSLLEYQKSRENNPNNLHPHVKNDLLSSIIKQCEKRELPADSWIEAYAISPDDNWKKYIYHYYKMAKSEQDDRHYVGLLEDKIGQLLEEDNFPGTFVYKNIYNALALTENDQLRADLIKRFMQASDDLTEINFIQYQQMILTGMKVLGIEALATNETLEFFETRIDTWTQQFEAVGVDSFRLVRENLFWYAALKRHNGFEASEILDFIDLQFSHLLSSDIPDTSETGSMKNILYNRKVFESFRNDLLQGYAESYASEKDFESANLFIGSISSADYKVSALEKSLSFADTIDEINTLTPDDLTQLFIPELSNWLDFHTARVNMDVDGIIDFSLKFAEALNEDDSLYFELQLLQSAIEFVNENSPQNSDVFAKELYQKLKPIKITYGLSKELAYRLIESGDTQVLDDFFDRIDQKSSDSADRLRSMKLLSKFLEKLEGGSGSFQANIH